MVAVRTCPHLEVAVGTKRGYEGSRTRQLNEHENVEERGADT